MAEFCKACAVDLFGKDTKDFAGLTKPEDWEAGKAACVLCETCGPIQVDPEGNCVEADCLEKGKEGHGLPWLGPRYQHDGECCTFLGRDGAYDLYHCLQGGRPTVIARASDDPPDYMSGMAAADVIPELAEAKRRAEALGLACEPKKEKT